MNRNEKRRWSRILAMILVFAMVFCDPSMSYAAEVVGEMLTAEAPATENVTEEDQAADYHKAQEIAWNDAVWLFLGTDQIVYATQDYLSGAYVAPDGTIRYQNAVLAE